MAGISGYGKGKLSQSKGKNNVGFGVHGESRRFESSKMEIDIDEERGRIKDGDSASS